MRYLLFILFFLLSCRKEGNIKEFKIKKGNHSSQLYLGNIKSNVIDVDILFDSSCIYDLKDSIQQHDINKLIGFTSCGSLHHTNSARFGWRWYNDSLQIFSYCYVNKNRIIEYIKSVNVEEWHNYQIIDNEFYYNFVVDDISTYTNKDSCLESNRYLLKPYFGGDFPAPHDIYIKIKWL